MKVSSTLHLLLHPKEWHFIIFGLFVWVLVASLACILGFPWLIAIIIAALPAIGASAFSDISDDWGYQKYNRDVDAFLVDALDNGYTFTNHGGYTIDINGVTFWIENYPHSFAYPYPGGAEGNMPSGKTKKRLYEKLTKDKLWKNKG